MKMGTNGATIATMLPDTSIDVEDDFESGSKNAKLMKAIKRLSKEEQEIILNLFGFVPPKK
jgi:DNA-directed RNA polymerase specialized sigma subunit